MRALKVVFALSVSVGAFTGFWAVGTMDFRSAAAAAEPIALEPEPVVAARPAYPLDLVLPDDVEAAQPRPSGVEVPDLSDMTALRALRHGRELGLVVDVRDEGGNRVPPAERVYMRVLEEGQSPAPGAFVEPGSTVRVVARYPGARLAAGY